MRTRHNDAYTAGERLCAAVDERHNVVAWHIAHDQIESLARLDIVETGDDDREARVIVRILCIILHVFDRAVMPCN